MDYAELTKLKVNKRFAIVIVLIRHQYAQILGNAADIFIELILKLDRAAQKLLEKYLADHLISVLSGTVKVYLDKPDTVAAFDPVLGENGERLLQMCELMAAFSPYHIEHFGRLGSFELDFTKQVKPMSFELYAE